ncbi:hypothetical protein AYL99_11347 [Fonsecaea erecta]|uniref:Uncharacterized protein n=1 Tax=Fonsecaea erecta TaxID=1367422 RepID=A0A178Z427_9EURO|nr:hypothetical protein AYL99_11347 [Fonsecaea erecta]OAP54246.1 hypothetical protein AYL99_11347 [Fonsecaea erecta]
MAFVRAKSLSALRAPLPTFQAASAGMLLILSLFVASASAYDGNICCMKAARVHDRRIALDQDPWDACALNDTDTYAGGTTFPSVNVTMGWCKANCPGSQQSDLSQWLQPLTSWVVPYIGLLLLCPFGGITKSKPTGTMTKPAYAWRWFWQFVRGYTQEWINLLGDPASAIFGAFSEIRSDVIMLREISIARRQSKRPYLRHTPWLELLKWVVILVGDTEFTQGSHRQDTEIEMAQAQKGRMVDHMLASKTEYEHNALVSPEPDRGVDDTSPDRMLVENAIKTLVEARTDFFKAVFLPTILFLAVTASIFYDAYTLLGDTDTANGLACGIWYSWLVILSVAANCFAGSVNAGLTKTTLGRYIDLSERSLPLRERYFNSMLWDEWLARIQTNPQETLSDLRPTDILLLHVKDDNTVFLEARQKVKSSSITIGNGLQLLIGHSCAWLCVATPVAGAFIISYNTPTVGLDCLSFNFLVYGILAFVTPALHVAYQWTLRNKGNKYMKAALKTTYWLFVCANAAVLTIGTVLQLAGVYRSCQCQLLFASESDLIEVNRNTPLAVENAKKYWLPVGYVAFGLVWVVCGLVTAARAYITVHIVDTDR